MPDDNLSKAELALIDRIVGAVGLAKFRNILWQKVQQAFGFSFHGTNFEYGFARAMPDERSLAYLKDRIFILSDKTQDKLVGDLRWEMLEGMRNAESIDQIKRRLDGIFEGNTVNTERIARTETLNAMNAGRQSAYEESGVVHYKMWRAAIGNARTAADSKRLNGQIQEVSNPFVDPKTGDSFMHPPNRPNCRCTTIPLRKLPENIVRKNGIIYSADEMVGKIEIDIGSLSKEEKRVWVKPTSKRKGHYRRVKGAKKVEEKSKVSDMVSDNVKEIVSGYDIGIVGSMHNSEINIVTFKNGSKGIYKVSKEASIIGEVEYYKVSKILYNSICPETVEDDFGVGVGSCQKWILGGDEPYGRGAGYGVNIEEKHFTDLAAIFVQDMIVGNWDRHGGNVIIKDDRCYAIDNEDWGTGGSADDYIHALDERSGISDVSGYSPMMKWLDKNLEEKEYAKFREYVIRNLQETIKHKDEIIDCYNQHSRFDVRINSVRDNIKYLEEYLSRIRK